MTSSRKTLTVAGIALLICFGAALSGGFYLFASSRGTTEPVREATEAFLRDLETGNLDSAYGKLCRETQANYPPDSFTAVVRAQANLASHRILGVTVNTVNGRRSGQVTAELNHANGFTDRRSILLVQQDDVWKVCGSPY